MFIVLQEPTPPLAFYPVASEQPHRINGVPAWRDTIFVRHDTIIVRHLRERRVNTYLKATLHGYGKKLELRVKEEASQFGHEGVVPRGSIQAAYEARIGPLSPGVYALILRDEGFGRRLKPFTLQRAIAVTRIGPVVTVRGRVVDDYSGAPVTHALVDVPEVDAPGFSDPVAVDSSGRFEVGIPGPRICHRLRVRAIGYYRTERTVDLASGLSIELGDVALRSGGVPEGATLLIMSCRPARGPSNAPWGIDTILAEPASPLKAQEATDHVALGIVATEARDLQMALQHFEAALQQDSLNYESNWRAALTLGLMGDPFPMGVKSAKRDSLYTRAERYAHRAVAANPTGADGHFTLAASLGRAALMAGPEEKVRRAILIRNEALRALAINPRHDGANHILGRWNAEIMRLSGINRFLAKHFLGARVLDQASWPRAIFYMEKAVKLAPGRIYHHLALADIYADANRPRDAEAQLRLVDSLPVREALDTNYRRQAASLRQRLMTR